MFTKRKTIFASASMSLVLALSCSFQESAFAQDSSPAPQQAPQDASTDAQNSEHTKQAAQDKALDLLKAAEVAAMKAQKAQEALKVAQNEETNAIKDAQKAERAKEAAEKRAQNAHTAATKADAVAKATKKQEDVGKAKQKADEAGVADREFAKASSAADIASRAMGRATGARMLAKGAADATEQEKKDAETALRAPGVAQAAQEALDADRAALTAVTATRNELETAKRASGTKATFEKEHSIALTRDSQSCLQPGVERTGAYYAPLWRPMAGTDYVVLGYDVQNHFVKWFDYKHQGAAPIYVDHNGSLVPVVYSREKVLVHVCGLHPTDTVSVSTNDVAVPEQGADIRGTTSSAATALAPTLDTLGTANAVGTAFGSAGVSFGSPPGVTALQTSLFTLGSSKDGTTYSDASLNIAPDDLALETLALFFNAQDALKTIDELAVGFKTTTNPNPVSIPPCDSEDAPGTICQLSIFANELEGKLEEEKGPSASTYTYHNYAYEGDDSLSAFNDFLARTQTLVSQMNGLAAGVGQAGLPPRAIALRQNLEAILGVTAQVDNLITDDMKFNNNPVLGPAGPADPTTKIVPPAEQAYYDSNSGTGAAPNYMKATCGALNEAISKGASLFTYNATTKAYSPYSPADNVTCHAMELYMMVAFHGRFLGALKTYSKLASAMGDLKAQAEKLQVGSSATPNSSSLHSAAINAHNLAAADITLDEAVNQATQLNKNLTTAAKETTNSLIDADTVESRQKLAAFAVQLKTGAALASSESQMFTSLEETASSKSATSGSLGTASTPPIISVESATQTVGDLFNKILAMRAALGALDATVGDVFAEMNDRYENTLVEQTDALPPLTSNTTVRIGINVQRNYTPFTLSGGATIGAAAPASTQSPASNSAGGQQTAGKSNQSGNTQSASPSGGGNTPSSTTSTSGSNDITVLMEVHRYANFNLVGGAMAIHVPTFSITAVPEYTAYGLPSTTTTTSGTTYTYSAMGTCNGGTVPMLVSTTSNSTGIAPAPALYYCYQTSQTSSLQPAGMAGIAWFPLHRDYFSRERGDSFRVKNLVPSLLVASSITSLGSAFYGANFEPVNGFDVFFGRASAHQASLPSGDSPYTVYPAGSTGNPPTLTTATNLKWGPSFGVGFDLSVFLQLFSKAQGPSLP